MPDQCETYLTIEGPDKKVREVVEFLSNKNSVNNPFASMVNYAFKSEEPIESISEKMYGFHESVPAFGTTDWGLKVTKATIYFTVTWGPPIDIFLELSKKFNDVGFLLDIDSTWELYYGKIYFLNGVCYYANYKSIFYDIEEFDIKLNINGNWEYMSMDNTKGLLVPIERLRPLTDFFIKANPEEMPKLLKFLPSYLEKYDGLEPEEYLPDNYIPKFYNNQNQNYENSND